MNQPPPIRLPHASSNDGALAPPGEAPSDPALEVDALKEIVADIETFVAHWVPRFDQMLVQCSATAERQEDDAQRSSDLDQQRRQWQQQRRHEAQRLKEQADWLTEAWLRLEQEQRTVLQAQAAWKQRGGASASEATGNPASAHAGPAHTDPGGTSSVDGASGGGVRISTRLSHQAPADQFELLRHTIGEPPASDR